MPFLPPNQQRQSTEGNCQGEKLVKSPLAGTAQPKKISLNSSAAEAWPQTNYSSIQTPKLNVGGDEWKGGERKGETERVRGKGMGHEPDQVWEKIDAPEYDYSYWYSYIATITDTTTVIIALLFQFFNLNSLLLLMPAHKRNRPQQLQHFFTGWMPYLSRSPNRSLSKHLR